MGSGKNLLTPRRYRFEFRPYQRRLRQPLTTSHGRWQAREGILLRLTDEGGSSGWGEIAPLPWLGSESLAQALDFCRQLPGKVTPETVASIPEALPACQFGFESALEALSPPEPVLPAVRLSYSYLLPAGAAALSEAKILRERLGSQPQLTFKWKIGVSSMAEEMRVFQQLAQELPPGGKLRLDANGGLNREQAQQWLERADESGRVEFIEQPLPPKQFDAMLGLAASYSTPLALDESAATLPQLEGCYRRGWRGIFAIKPAIAGSPRRLRQLCQQHSLDATFSSALETSIGRQAALRLATELSNPSRALGFGVDRWFEKTGNEGLENPWEIF